MKRKWSYIIGTIHVRQIIFTSHIVHHLKKRAVKHSVPFILVKQLTALNSYTYIWESVIAGQLFIWIILPVFPVIEVNAEPIKLQKKKKKKISTFWPPNDFNAWFIKAIKKQNPTFALFFVNLGHGLPDSAFRRQQYTDLSVRLCFESWWKEKKNTHELFSKAHKAALVFVMVSHQPYVLKKGCACTCAYI